MQGKNMTVWTGRGVPLSGILFSKRRNSRIMICITGIHGNPYSNPFYFPLGERLSSEGTDFIMAHVCDAFGRIPVKNRVTGKDETIGSWNEDFGNVVDDVKAYVDYAESRGYGEIYLAGHSLGANKVIRYLSETHDSRISKFLLMSPAEMPYLRDQASASERRCIERMMKEGKGNEFPPFQLFGWIPCIASTAYQWLSDRSLDNVHPEHDGDFSQLSSIDQDCAMLIGDLDSFTRRDPEGFIENINAHTAHPERNIVRIIGLTGHTYQGAHQALCDTVSAIVAGWCKCQ